jgi:hypothetical protein
LQETKGEVAVKAKKTQKKTRSPRIAQRLPRDAQGLYTHCSATWIAIKGDPGHYPSPYPPPNEVDGDLQALGDALKDAEGGDPVAIAALDVAEAKVRQTFEMLGKYVQSILRASPIEDVPALIASVLMYASNVGQRPPKQELEVKRGTMSGMVRLIALAVASAVSYHWEFSLDQLSWSPGGPTAQADTRITGLTPGKMYYFRFHVFTRENVTTEPSQVVSFMVT